MALLLVVSMGCDPDRPSARRADLEALSELCNAIMTDETVPPDRVIDELLERFRATDPAPVFEFLWGGLVAPEDRYRVLQDTAAEAELPDWRCEPLEVAQRYACCYPDAGAEMSIPRTLRSESFSDVTADAHVVTITSEALLVDGAYVDDLQDRRIGAGARVSDVSLIVPDLQSPVEEFVYYDRRWARRGNDDQAPIVALLSADRRTRFDTLLAVVATTAAAGVERVELAVRRGETFRDGMFGQTPVALVRDFPPSEAPSLVLTVTDGGFVLSDARGVTPELSVGGAFREPVDGCPRADDASPTICLREAVDPSARYNYRQLYNRLVEVRDYEPWRAVWAAEPSIAIAAAGEVEVETLVRTIETASVRLARDNYPDDQSFADAEAREQGPPLFSAGKLIPPHLRSSAMEDVAVPETLRMDSVPDVRGEVDSLLTLTVSQDTISLADGRPVIDLFDGAISRSERRFGTSLIAPDLLRPLARSITHEPGARDRGEGSALALRIRADRSTRFDVLTSILATASEAGFEEADLAVRRSRDPYVWRWGGWLPVRAALRAPDSAEVPIVVIAIRSDGFVLSDLAGGAGALGVGGSLRAPVAGCPDAGQAAPTICLRNGTSPAERFDFRQLYNRLGEIRAHEDWRVHWSAAPQIVVTASADVDLETVIRTIETARVRLQEDAYDDDESFAAATVRETDRPLFPIVVLQPPATDDDEEGAPPSEMATVRVSNAEELLAAIGSNRTIVLAPGEYDLQSVLERVRDGGEPPGSPEHLGWSAPGYRDAAITVRNVSNLRLVGPSDGRGPTAETAHLLMANIHRPVLMFEGVVDVSIENVSAGHGELDGYCVAPVFGFTNASNIEIERSLLYGSGGTGADLLRVRGFRLSHSAVRSCTYSVLSIRRSSDILVVDSDLEHSACTSLLYSVRSEGVRIERSTIDFDCDDQRGLFRVEHGPPVSVVDSSITSSPDQCLFASPDAVVLERTRSTNVSECLGDYE